MSCSVISIFRLARGGLFVQNIISVSYHVGVTVGVVSHRAYSYWVELISCRIKYSCVVGSIVFSIRRCRNGSSSVYRPEYCVPSISNIKYKPGQNCYS